MEGRRISLYGGLLLLLLQFSFVYAVEEELTGEQIRQKIEDLRKQPIVAEYIATNREIERLNNESNEKVTALALKNKELAKTQEFIDYKKKEAELQALYSDSWLKKSRAIAAAAKEIYGQRHAELKGKALPSLPQAQKLGFDLCNFPVLNGSTSTHPLNVIIASRFLGVSYEWSYPDPCGYPGMYRVIDYSRYYGSLFNEQESIDSLLNSWPIEFRLSALRIFAKLDKPGDKRVPLMINRFLAHNSSTHKSYVNLINGDCDLILVARELSASEKKLAAGKGVKLKLIPVAKDAFVFVVNHKNNIKGLTKEQIKDIYRKKNTCWSELNPMKQEVVTEKNTLDEMRKRLEEENMLGSGDKIEPLMREPESASRELFDKLAMGGEPLDINNSYSNLYTYGQEGPFSMLTHTENGIGYSVYYYEHFMSASPLTRTLAIDGIEPNYKTISNGTYPWVTYVYAVIREGEPDNSPGKKLLNWLVSDEGQAVVRESGYIPLKSSTTH